MARRPQLLEIEPALRMTFTGPFTTPVKETITLSNPTTDRMFFKVKTTVPRRYCVRPNQGVIEAKSSSVISVTLQTANMQAEDQRKHKFLIQSIVASGEQELNDEVWRDAAERVMETKLKCVFENVSDNEQQPDDISAGDVMQAASDVDYVQQAQIKEQQLRQRVLSSPADSLSRANEATSMSGGGATASAHSRVGGRFNAQALTREHDQLEAFKRAVLTPIGLGVMALVFIIGLVIGKFIM